MYLLIKRIIKKTWFFYSLLIGLTLIITFPAFLTAHHILYNLEPYPDGLLYALSARNLAQGKGLQLVYQESVIPVWVPPMYAYSLVPGYIISQAPQMFYASNIFFGVVTLILLIYLAEKVSDSKLAGLIAGFTYLSHALVTWMTNVPLTENFTPLLLLMALTGLLLPKQRHWLILSVLGITGLFLTRYAVILTVIITLIFLVARYAKSESKNSYKIVLAVFAAAILVAILTLYILTGQNLPIITRSFFTSVLSGTQFYGLKFVPGNLVAYSMSLLGAPTKFLWQDRSFTSLFIAIPVLSYLIYSFKASKVKHKKQNLILLSIFLAQYPILLVFYTVDTRYSILVLPIFALGIASLFSHVRRQFSLSRAIMLIAFLFLGHGFTQLPLFKEVLANNIFHRSQAWQYEAIKHFDEYFAKYNSSDEFLITAIPPHLVEAYQTVSYRLLPLSPRQEFFNKQVDAWGDDVIYQNLLQDYHSRIEQGREVYVSNAYITHQTEVVQDFELIQKQFDLQLVSEGCHSTCNIYRLSLLDSVE